ncbi:MAG: tRNA(Ile)-lysidine synthase [Erysipelotrichaceae bacterium]|nr:MAG: tRNA(Ile)-lysidine [Erysipelotrichaceae bacterium]TXT20004.1 MAG: tRNA(Ile)-lysidine synthase [Erysipelotrichaceae bacterium]
MALLELARVNKVQCLAVHVNYHKRDTADRDMLIVETYCVTNKIPLFIFDAGESTGNFQDFARQFRYEKFAEVAKNQHALGVLVAHHLMDDVETYLIQKQRRSQVTYYGLKSQTTLHDITVERPLLKITKEALMAYCDEQKIEYGIDESNFSDDYLRNRIRKELINEKLHGKIASILSEKDKENQDLNAFKIQYQYQLEQDHISLEDFNALEYPVLYLQLWIRAHVKMKLLSEDHLVEILRQIQTTQNFKQKLGLYRLIKQYGQIVLLSPQVSYTYLLKEVGHLETPYFEILCTADPQHAFEVTESDFPLTIRNAQKGETYVVDEKPHKLSRWFISHKISQGERESWPVVLNCHNEVIHIARIRIPRCLNTHKTHLYMIK